MENNTDPTTTISKPKPPKMDRHLVSKQQWEIDYVQKRFGVPDEEVIKALIDIWNNSRQKIYKALRDLGYVDSKTK